MLVVIVVINIGNVQEKVSACRSNVLEPITLALFAVEENYCFEDTYEVVSLYIYQQGEENNISGIKPPGEVLNIITRLHK